MQLWDDHCVTEEENILSSSKNQLSQEEITNRSYQQLVSAENRSSGKHVLKEIQIFNSIFQDLSEENRNLKRLIARQDKELGKFVNTESDLPVILRAHNEETRVLKMKIKQVNIFWIFFIHSSHHCL